MILKKELQSIKKMIIIKNYKNRFQHLKNHLRKQINK
jgi:hypothetical protein